MTAAAAAKARPIPDSHLDLLTRPVHAVLTTMGPDGQPQSSLVWVDVRRLDRITSAMEQGRLGFNVRLFADERDRRVVTGLTHQFLLTFLGAVSGIVAAVLLGTSGGPKVTPTITLFQVIGYNLLIVASILVLRVLFTIFRDR